jgi:hypothetical protein
MKGHRMRNLLNIFIFLLLAFFLLSCSTAKRDYENAQKLQDAAGQSIQNTPDYEIKIKSCDDAIIALQSFIQKHPDGEWTAAAQTSLLAWQSKKENFEKELNQMTGKLSKNLAEYAAKQAMSKHPVCNIEEMKIQENDSHKEGTDIVVKNNYAVRMKGALFGVNIFKLNVKVSGRIAMDTKEVTIDDKATVEE